MNFLNSLDLMLAEYKPGLKSAHWAAIYTGEMAHALRDPETIARFRSNFLRKDLVEPGSWFRAARSYRYARSLSGTDWIDRYAETKIGEPETLLVDGREVNEHDLDHIATLWKLDRLSTAAPSVIVEIGGGYGGLANKMKRRWPGLHYVSLDLPEALTLQAYYLSKLYPDAKFYLFENYQRGEPVDPQAYDFTLLPGWLAPKLKDASVDIFINMRSMMEMNADTIADYFSHIERCLKAGGFFYNANRYRKDIGGVPVRIREYPYDRHWRVVSSVPLPLQPFIHELVTQRTMEASDAVARELAALPAEGPTVKSGKKIGLLQRLSLLPLRLKPRAK